MKREIIKIPWKTEWVWRCGVCGTKATTPTDTHPPVGWPSLQVTFPAYLVPTPRVARVVLCTDTQCHSKIGEISQLGTPANQAVDPITSSGTRNYVVIEQSVTLSCLNCGQTVKHSSSSCYGPGPSDPLIGWEIHAPVSGDGGVEVLCPTCCKPGK